MKIFMLYPAAKSCRYEEMYAIAMKKLWGIDSHSSDKSCVMNRAIRTSLIILFILQLVSTLERQIFDFLGYMWAPIIGNFFQIIVVIIGIFGACNFSRSLVIVYATWSLLWLGWNIFVICLYLEVGILNRNRERYILTIGTEGRSWWLEHGIGCEVTNSSWGDQDLVDQGSNSLPELYVVGCILQYYYVEVIHAGVQCLLSLLGFVAACVCIYLLIEGDDEPLCSASDELEFVKMKHHTPTHLSYLEGMSFDNINLTTELSNSTPRPRNRGDRETPPSYDMTMKNTQWMGAGSHYYGTESHSLRSKTNIKSKWSTHRPGSFAHNAKYDEPLGNLPWVQIAPSTDAENRLIRHYP